MILMIFNNDRMQYAKKEGMYYLNEFIKVKDIHTLQKAMVNSSQFFEALKKQISPFDQQKLDFIATLKQDMFKLLIVYQDNVDTYLLWMNCRKNGHEKAMFHTYDFKGMQQIFQTINNKDGQRFVGSKKLGARKGTVNEEPFVNRILEKLHGMKDFHDDNGIGLTKQLLEQYKRHGVRKGLVQNGFTVHQITTELYRG